MHAIEVAFESVYVSRPEPAELSQPKIQLLKWFRLQPVETALCVDPEFDETGTGMYTSRHLQDSIGDEGNYWDGVIARDCWRRSGLKYFARNGGDDGSTHRLWKINHLR